MPKHAITATLLSTFFSCFSLNAGNEAKYLSLRDTVLRAIRSTGMTNCRALPKQARTYQEYECRNGSFWLSKLPSVGRVGVGALLLKAASEESYLSQCAGFVSAVSKTVREARTLSCDKPLVVSIKDNRGRKYKELKYTCRGKDGRPIHIEHPDPEAIKKLPKNGPTWAVGYVNYYEVIQDR